MLAERLQALQLEDLREFLQEQLAASFLFRDDVVVEHLQAAMSELRSKKLDVPPPGTAALCHHQTWGSECPLVTGRSGSSWMQN